MKQRIHKLESVNDLFDNYDEKRLGKKYKTDVSQTEDRV